MSVFASLVASLSDALAPLFGGAATAAAIVACTLAVRLALHPLARAAVRGERVRARLAPRVAELQRKHKNDPERLRREMGAVYKKEGVSPAAGCLPLLLQLPVFFAMYHLFTTDDGLLGHTLLGAPLGGRWTDALGDGGVFGAHGLVYVGLFVLTGAVATWTYLRGRRLAAQSATGMTGPFRYLSLLAFGTLITVAVVPLAAALYVVTSTTWTAVERAALGAGKPPEEAGRRGGATGDATGDAARAAGAAGRRGKLRASGGGASSR
ncbi:YidC/Oxa1 family membrane protein insertase [Streptomyces albiaxialis]|uniref:Membrane protein insertase YidC n=1 Tax=Streptomyces albiaxialis TaxID=329523 RepID=A0ABN2WE82_9ACTN